LVFCGRGINLLDFQRANVYMPLAVNRFSGFFPLVFFSL
jgi:hypothetical protein